MFKKRIISSIVLISIIVATLFIDWLCSLLIAVFIIAGLYEFFTMLEKKGISLYKYVGIGIGAIIPFSIIFRFEPTKSWELLFIVLLLLFLIDVMRNHPKFTWLDWNGTLRFKIMRICQMPIK